MTTVVHDVARGGRAVSCVNEELLRWGGDHVHELGESAKTSSVPTEDVSITILTTSFTREGLCHNSAVFEAEFLAITALLGFVLTGVAVRRVVLSSSKNLFVQFLTDGAELAVLAYAMFAVAQHNYEYAVGRSVGEKFSRNPYLEMGPRSAMYLSMVAILVYVFEEYGFDWVGAVRRWRGGSSSSLAGLEQTLRMFFALFPLAVTIVVDLAVFCRGKYLIFDNAPEVLYHMRTGNKPVFQALFQLAAPVREFQTAYLAEQPMLLDFLLDFPCTVGFYHLLKWLDGREGEGEQGRSELTKLTPGSSSVVVGDVVAHPARSESSEETRGSSTTSTSAPSSSASSPDDVVAPSSSSFTHQDGAGTRTPISAASTSSERPQQPLPSQSSQQHLEEHMIIPVRPQRSTTCFTSIMSKLAFGTNLSNIFLLHYLFCYLNAQKTRMTYPAVIAMVGFVFFASSALSAITFLFLEHPMKSIVSKWVLVWL